MDQILTRLKKSGLSDGQLDVIKDSIKTLEKRKTDFDDRISDRELAKVYQDINRLLEATDGAKLSQHQRTILAQQILFQAAHPDEISQGYHNTCNVTTLENIMYSRQPSLVSKVVVDAALTGQFKTADDTVVKLSAQNLRPDAEASNNPPFDGERSFASQIFQETAVNVYWQRQSIAPDGSTSRKGDIHYEVGVRDAALGHSQI